MHPNLRIYTKMNITKENIDALNAVVKVDIVAEDYQDRVTKVLKDYRKNANVPGFRKGNVPLGMIKKQYGKAVMIDEVNKLLQESLNTFLQEEKLDILGNPLPKMQEDFSWDTDTFSFEFELGLTPEFEVNLKGKNKIINYEIEATEDLLEKEVENIRNRYGEVTTLEKVTETTNTITGTFVNNEKEIEKKSSFEVSELKGDKNQKKIIGAKVGDTIELETKGLFEDDHKLQHILEIPHDEVHGLDIKVVLTIEEITKTEPAVLDQELFDRLFSDKSVTTITELKEKIKDDAEKQFKEQSDQQLLNSINDYLIENTKFDLPQEFLEKWLQNVDGNPLTEEQAKAEYKKSEKGLRYQLIESKIIKDNNINVGYGALVEYTENFIRMQMTQFGKLDPSKEELESITTNVLNNKEEVQRLQRQMIPQKLLTFYKENMSFKSKKLSYSEFIEEVYKTVPKTKEELIEK